MIVLHEYWRWSGDDALIKELRDPLERALIWLDAYGDRDGAGYIEYLLEAETGLANQGWKDSGDSVRLRAAPHRARAGRRRGCCELHRARRVRHSPRGGRRTMGARQGNILALLNTHEVSWQKFRQRPA